MSGDVACYGYMAELETPLTAEEVENFDVEGFRVNYEGTIIRHEIVRRTNNPYVSAVFGESETHGITFPLPVVGKAKPFVDVYYDGCDAPMDELTVEEFRKI